MKSADFGVPRAHAPEHGIILTTIATSQNSASGRPQGRGAFEHSRSFLLPRPRRPGGLGRDGPGLDHDTERFFVGLLLWGMPISLALWPVIIWALVQWVHWGAVYDWVHRLGGQ
jgi:hypothetical protein